MENNTVNTCKITVVGDNAVVTSAVKLSDLKKLQKFNPSALILKGGEDGKQIKFICTVGAKAEATATGASFTSETHDGNGYATMTLPLNETVEGEALKAALAEKYGAFLANMHELEETIPFALATVDADIDTAKASIELA